MWSGIKTRFNLNKYSFLLIGIFVFILLAASLFTAQYIHSNPFTINSASSIYAYRLNNIQKNEGSVLGIMGKKNEIGFENLMFGNRKSGMAGFYLSDKNGVEMKLEVDKKIQNGEVMPVTSKGKDGEAIVTYKDIAKDTDLIYKTTTSQIKEEIIINTREAAENAESYTFNLNIEGLTYQKNEDNTVIPTFTSIKDTETTYTIPPAFMIDSKGAKSYGVTTTITEDETNPNTLIITLTPNMKWLLSTDRQFPIIIDPTLVKGNPPILSLNFDEGQGATTYDGGANSHDGTITTAAWVEESRCVSGRCLSYDGTNDYVTFTDNATLDIADSTNLTVGAWVKLNTVASTQTIVSKKTSTAATDAGYILTYNSSSSIFELRVADGTDQFIINSKTVTDTSRWIHVEAVFDEASSTNSQIYINGQEAKASTTGNISNVNSLENSIDLTIGTQGNGNADLNGFVDSVKIYNYARTSTQVRQDYAAKGGVMGVAAQFGPDTNNKLSDGLVGYWKMDESAANTCSGLVNDSCDSSGNGLDGSWTGNSTYTVDGKYGYGTIHDGSGDYININDSPLISFTGPFTVAAWVKRSSTNTADGIFGKYDSSLSQRSYMLGMNTSFAQFTVSSNGVTTTQTTGTTAISSGQWYHIAGVYDGSNIRVFVNGVQESMSSHSSGVVDNGSALHIGDGDNTFWPFHGVIDEARIYNRALSEGEIRSLYNYAAGPVAYWKFDEKTGTTAYDSSGNANTASFVNTPLWTFGKYGSALTFNGSNTYLTVPDSATVDFGTNSFTASAWVKYNGTASTQDFILHKWESGLAGGYALNMQSDGTLRFGIEDDGSSFPEDSAESTVAYDDGEWHHVTGVKTGTDKIELYVDGVLVGSDLSLSANLSLDSASMLYLGSRYSASQQWYGEIDEIKLYNYARTPGQIVEDMNASHPAPGSPVGSAVGHWKFDEGYGDTTRNLGNGGSALDGDLNGSCPGAATCPTWTNTGKFGKALNFDGGDAVQVPYSSPLAFQTDYTYSAWVKTSSTNVNIMVKRLDLSTWSAGGNLMYIDPSGYLSWTAYGIGVCNSTKNVADNAWHHTVLTVSGSLNNLDLYVDGSLVKRCTAGFPSAASYSMWFGDLVSGSLDEVKIYNYYLTSDQIKAEYNQGKAQVLGAKGTESDGKTPSFSSSREYCVPGDTSTCNSSVAVYQLDEDTGTTANNSMGGSYTGTLTNGPTWRIGKYGKGVNMDGDNDYIETGNSFNPNSAYSVSMWAYLRTTSTDDSFFSSSTSETTGLALYIGNGTNNNLIYCNDNICAGTSASNDGVLTDNAWQHITLTYNGSGTSRFYVNGVDVTSDSANSETADTGNKIFGNYDTNTTNAIDGVLDEIHVYDYVRTPAQVVWEYNRGAPAAHYKFDECSGSTIQDWSPNANGRYNNRDGKLKFGLSPTIGDCTTSSTAWYNGAEGKINASMSFDGSDDEVIITDTTNSVFDFPSGQEMTVSAWINPSNLPGVNDYASIFSKSGTNGNGYYAQIQGNGALEFCIFNTGGGGCYTTTRTPVTTSAWQHLTYSITVGNGSTMRIYYNGQLLSGSWNDDGSTIPAADNATVNIGSSGSGSEPFNGRIDDLRLYRYTATQNQINTIMNDSSAVRFK